jgi:hypothetical protein
MKTIAILALLCGAVHAKTDDKDAVANAAKKLAEAGSYTFKGEVKVDSPLGGGGQQIPGYEGKFDKELGSYVTIGDRGEFFRKGDKIFVKQQQGEWTELEKAQLAGGGQGGQNRQRGMMAGRMFLRNMKSPHDEVKELPKGFKELKKEEKSDKVGEKECAVYGGDLTEEGIKASPLGRMIGGFGALGGGAAQNIEMSGKGRVWIDGDGNLQKFELTTKMSFDFQGNGVEFSMVRATEISNVGKTKVEVPEAVKKLLEKPAEKSDEKKDEK